MRRLPPGKRIGTFICFLLLTCQTAAATSILVRSSATALPTATLVQTYAGKIDVVVSPVKPGTALTVVLLLAGLSAAERESINKEVLALYSTQKGRELRITVLQNGSAVSAGPFASRTRLKSALDKTVLSSEIPPSVSPTDIYDALAAGAAQWGSNWSCVLLIGNLPLLEPAAREYATALLMRAFGSQHIRVSLFQPSGEDEKWLPLFRSTGGTIVRGDLSDFSRAMSEVPDAYIQVDWLPAIPANGFVVSHSNLLDSSANVVFEVPEIAASEGAQLPSVAQYSGMQANIAEAAKLLEPAETSAVDAERIREDLRSALWVNPLEPTALLTA